MSDNEVILEMKHIDMRFRGVHAVDDVSFTLRRGEVHALVGENGAGKTTLMKVLVGLYSPNAGEIVFEGVPVKFRNVGATRTAGICMIFQEFNQVKHLTVMENIYLGREPKTKTGSVNYKQMFEDSRVVLNKIGVEIDPKTFVRDLTVAKQQLVEIAKAVSFNARIIIMDEPTSALSDTEINRLFETVRTLKAEGKAIVFISHKLEEIFGVCDRVTILRDGRFIHSDLVKNINESELIHMMVDREISEMFPKEESEIGDITLEVKGLTCKGVFEDISFNLRRGEILGLSGLMGAGRTEVVEAIVGSRKLDHGEIFLDGKKIVNRMPGDAIARGIIMVPEDRKKHGLALKMSVKDNILMSALHKCLKGGYIRKNLEKKYSSEYMTKLDIKADSDRQICSNLSGGNQQKVVIARILNADPNVIILDEPTRGIDVKTKADIHKLMSQLAVQGKAVLMISSELNEVLGMSDRIIVLHEGKLTGTLKRSEANAERIMQYAIGKMEEEVH
ncbi:MAG: sugar ABC transporter ATP-binding protein [Spirochaetes bacterium]|nr:sugar ABC transporter ATP-binding protein [Spirochaetota bacterium]